MIRKKLPKDHVILFAPIERKYHDALRLMAFKTHRSIADLTRSAIKDFVITKKAKLTQSHVTTT